MIENLLKSDVVIKDNDGYCIALKYDEKYHKAPVVTAYGHGKFSKHMKAVANKNDIPIVLNKRLCHKLYFKIGLNKEIPSSLYSTVAAVLAYIFKTNYKYNETKKLNHEIKTQNAVDNILKIEMLKINVGIKLIPLVDEIIEELGDFREKLASIYGFDIQGIKIRDDVTLKSN